MLMPYTYICIYGNLTFEWGCLESLQFSSAMVFLPKAKPNAKPTWEKCETLIGWDHEKDAAPRRGSSDTQLMGNRCKKWNGESVGGGGGVCIQIDNWIFDGTDQKTHSHSQWLLLRHVRLTVHKHHLSSLFLFCCQSLNSKVINKSLHQTE